MLFALLNNEHFAGEIPAHRIAYNARFSNLAGRITYKPPLIELSPKHFERHPKALRETLMHEMIHAWLYARGENPGHNRDRAPEPSIQHGITILSRSHFFENQPKPD